jgi:hypothetical protein
MKEHEVPFGYHVLPDHDPDAVHDRQTRAYLCARMRQLAVMCRRSASTAIVPTPCRGGCSVAAAASGRSRPEATRSGAPIA